MKTILTTLCLLVGLSAYGQTAVRSLAGNATNLNAWGSPNGNTNALMLFSRPNQTAFVFVITNMAGPADYYFGYVDSNGQWVFPVAVATNFIGNGAGLTNLIGATNFSSSVTYNFNGKVTFNSVSYNTNLWAGPTNTLILSTNYQDYVTTTDVNITNVGGQLAGQNTWATLTISNASAGDITVRSTASGIRAQGSGTSAAMVVGAGKEGILSYLSRDFKSTNYVTTAQQ